MNVPNISDDVARRFDLPNISPPAPRTAFCPPPGKAPHRLRVLVAEDSPANQLIVERMLQARGHEVRIAENGSDAVEAAAREPFDVVLMDIQMPRMDGIEATRRIRTSGRAAGVPIVGFSAYAGPLDRANCFAVGMNAFLAKPADFRMLTSTLERIAGAG